MQLALIISFAVLFNLCCCEKLSVCKTILVETGEAGDVKKTCEGQTVFVNQQGPKGEKEEMGPKGEKGDSGSGESVKSLRDKITELGQSVTNNNKALNDKLAAKATDKDISQLRSYLLAKPESGWFNGLNGYQYKITTKKQSYEAGRKMCKQWGGDLAVVGAKDTILAIAALKNFKDTRYSFIGLNDLKKEGDFVWLDGTRGSYNWAGGEPNGGRRENCVTVYDSGKFNDFSCSSPSTALCEKKLNV